MLTSLVLLTVALQTGGDASKTTKPTEPAAQKDAVLEAPPAARGPDSRALEEPEEDGDIESPRSRRKGGEETALESLTFRQRYLPLWFPDELHPQLEDVKWTYVLGALFVPAATFWSPYFLVSPNPQMPFQELLKTTIVHLIIQVAGHVALYAAWLVLGVTCPPGFGFYLWFIPMYVGQAAWLVVGNWQLIMAMLAVWDASLKDQGIPDDPRRKPRKRRDDAKDEVRAPLVAPDGGA